MINIFYVKLVLIYRTLDLDMGEVQNSFGGMFPKKHLDSFPDIFILFLF
jgi:hypothetical protein